MQQIETAFGDGNLNKAKKLISDLRKERPGIDLSEYDKKLIKIEWAQREFSQCAKMKLAGDKISKCIMILQQVKDFIPAQNLLNSQELRPNPVKELQSLQMHQNSLQVYRGYPMKIISVLHIQLFVRREKRQQV